MRGKMKIHSRILAIVLSIFLIQATDPPHDGGNSGSLIDNAKFLPLESKSSSGQGLEVLQHYLTQIKGQTLRPKKEEIESEGEFSKYHAINRFLQREGKTEYERLLEKDFVRPLLKLYHKQRSESPETQQHLVRNFSFTEKLEDSETKSEDKSSDKNEKSSPVAFSSSMGPNDNFERIATEKPVELRAITSHDLKSLMNQESTLLPLGQRNLETTKLYQVQNQTNQQLISPTEATENTEGKQKHKPKTKSQDLQLLVNQRSSYTKSLPFASPVRRDDVPVTLNFVHGKGPLPNQPSTSSIRRDDNFETIDLDPVKENIGEILPLDYNADVHKMPHRQFLQLPSRRNFRVPSEENRYQYRKPIRFQDERPRPDFEPTSLSSDDLYHYGESSFQEERQPRPTRVNLQPPSEVSNYRLPRRLRGFREVLPEILQSTGRDQFFEPKPQKPNWQGSWGSRRPRVIFPSDLVAFREPNQEEPDWLAPDSNLQDLQEADTRDRGSEELCASGATCEFFLSCWLSGGLLESPCQGLLRGCCQRGASKKGESAGLAIGTLEAPRETPKAQSGLFDITNSCGISNSRQQAQRRIVGGDEPGFGTFPWQAYIRVGSSRCGGSLVSRRHVVTAGHCVARATPKQVHVTLGDYVINSAVEPLPAYTFGVSQIQVHPYFKFTPQADRFDVAVLRLDRTAQSLPHIAPICLPPRGEGFLGEVGVAAGWGALSPGSRLRPQTLQSVQVPVIDNRVCERWHRSKGIGVVIYDEMLCAGYKNGGRDSCQGDSGGPLMLQRQGRWYLIGIVSAGYSCAQAGQPGIYHRVAHTVDWITRTIGA